MQPLLDALSINVELSIRWLRHSASPILLLAVTKSTKFLKLLQQWACTCPLIAFWKVPSNANFNLPINFREPERGSGLHVPPGGHGRREHHHAGRRRRQLLRHREVCSNGHVEAKDARFIAISVFKILKFMIRSYLMTVLYHMTSD